MTLFTAIYIYYAILQLCAIHPVPMEEHVCPRMDVLVAQDGLDLPVDKVNCVCGLQQRVTVI